MGERVKSSEKKLPCGDVVIRPYGYELRFGLCGKKNVYKDFRERLKLSKVLEKWFFYDSWEVYSFDEWVRKFPKHDAKIKRIIGSYKKKSENDGDDLEDYRDNISLEIKEIISETIIRKSRSLGEDFNIFMEEYLEIVPDYFELKKRSTKNVNKIKD